MESMQLLQFGYFWISFIIICVKSTSWGSEEYDFIIVGAGSAGSTIAARLSEIPEITVLLLEAGEEPPAELEVPLYVGKFWDSSNINWGLKTEKQKQASLAFINQKTILPFGKMLGGSSSINAMVFTRGNKNDFDRWASSGNEGWSYEDVLPFFLKMEDYRVPFTKYDAPYHSEKGPVTISQPSYRSPLATAFLEAGKEMDYFKVDYNAEVQKGFMTPVFNIRKGSRCGTYKAYLEPNKKRPNLIIETKAFVTKIIIENKEAKGVQYEKDGQVRSVKAKKEVILSAGAPFSPQLLMLSGIGPQETLDKFQIPVSVDLPGVGRNLQDHLTVNGLSFTIEEPIGINFKRDINQNSLSQYDRKKIGVLAVPLAVEGISFMDSSYADTKIDFPDFELIFTSTEASPLGLTQKIKNLINPPDSRDYITIYPVLLHPDSKGYITLRSSNHKDLPIYEPLFLTKEKDIKILLDVTDSAIPHLHILNAVKAIFELINTTSFQRFGVKYHNQKIPQCQNHKGDEYWICFIKHFSMPLSHSSDTCKMGPETDYLAVVDPQLKVHGVKGLRIADASIMPIIITGHTNAATIMIGEKASDMIKKHWNLL